MAGPSVAGPAAGGALRRAAGHRLPGLARRAVARRPLSLRMRLVLMLVGVVAVLCATVGVVSTLAVQRFQLGQRDEQVLAAAERASRPPPFGVVPDNPPDSPPNFPRGQGIGTLQGSIVDGQVSAWIRGPDTDESLTGQARAVLDSLPVDGRPHTLDLPGLGQYRLVAIERDSRGALGGPPAGDEAVIAGLPLDDLLETRKQLIAVELGAGLAVVLVAAGAGFLLIRLTLRPLDRVAATAGRVAELPLHSGEVSLADRVPDADADPRTEVGQVGAALNRMLGHVADALGARQASETRLRRFIADASHELRTPLAAIRGYTELSRRGLHAAPAEMVYAIDRVDSAAARMTTLVEDLLLLARLDAGRPLRREPVDLSALVVEAATDAHVAGPDHRWALNLPPEAVTVPGDPDRLHQVLGNLLANARVHTAPGTTVTTGLALDGDRAVLRVLDDGPGISADLRDKVFERFARGDGSRSRTAGSSGLGLAIVASVVAAHHGTVEVDSEPGRTAFTVRLPVS